MVTLTVLAACVAGGLYAYDAWLRKVRIAFVGYQDVAWAAFDAAAQKTSYAVHRLERDELAQADLSGYNAVFLWGMGLNLSNEQVAALDRAGRQGTKVVVTSATNDRSKQQINVSDSQREAIFSYLQHAGEENHVALLHFVARELAGKDVEVPPLVTTPIAGFFYRGGELFETRRAFEEHVARQGTALQEDAPRVVLFGSFLRPKDPFHRRPVDALIRSFERRGIRVYPIFGRERTIELLQQVKPDLAVVFPHGRLAPNNEMPAVLASLNIPCLSGLSLSESIDEWMEDERGMAGGSLSQSIAMPELDGAVEPFALVSLERNERGIRVPQGIAERIERFTARAANWLELRRKANAEKRIVIVYYKAPGLASLSAAGLEVCPSLWNVLNRLQQEGYDLGGKLPESPEALFELIQRKGKTLGQWAIGSYEAFLEEAEPEFVPAADYAQWLKGSLSEKRRKEILELWGPVPGKQMTAEHDGKPCLVISRIRLGNVVLMPQPTVGGEGSDEVQSIHGTDKAPPHFYLAAYLWARYGFQADAIVHFGTHGSLEFTYGKSAALSRDCWPDILIGDVPHVYPYIINNVGEALVAKRRSYGVTVSHLTPPFTEASLYGELVTLQDKLQEFSTSEDPDLRLETRRAVTELARKLDLGEELGLESLDARLLTDDQIEHLEDYIHDLQQQSITDGLHVIGRQLDEEQVRSTVAHMLGEPGYEAMLAATDHRDNPAAKSQRKALARALVDSVLDGKLTAEKLLGGEEAARLREKERTKAAAAGHGGHPHHQNKGRSASTPEDDAQPADNDGHEERTSPATDFAPVDPASFWDGLQVVGDEKQKLDFLRLLDDIQRFADELRRSPDLELDSFVLALRGGYIEPSSGGDPLINPQSVPTGRNLYSINAEATPTEEAWRVGCRVADEILAQHRAASGRWPRQVAVSLWGSEFIRDKGTTIAEILYFLGVRPLRNSRGSVYDVEIIPSEELGRPRIDVLVQTSGQFRDAAASRIALLDKAVQMVSRLGDETFPNYVREGSTEAEMALKSRGYAPKEARELSTARIFGAAGNQSYGTGIMGLVEKGDAWQDEKEVADRYVRNMSGIYRDGRSWGTYKEGVLEVQLQGVEAVIHSRSSNTWGPLSLDHVYEFMGGITLSVRAKTGNDPVGYFSDLRTRGRAKATTAVAAIREEARTTLWNPKFIQGLQREGPSAAGTLTETVRNLYGWNVMQPSAIDEQMWNETYAVLVADKHGLDMRRYFESKNPYALEDLAAVMLETARKGYWSPSQEVLQELARVHAELVAKYGAACSYETCGNRQLQEFLQGQLNAPGSQVPADVVAAYRAGLTAVTAPSRPLPEVEGMELEEKVEKAEQPVLPPSPVQTVALAGCLVLLVLVILALGAGQPRRARTI